MGIQLVANSEPHRTTKAYREYISVSPGGPAVSFVSLLKTDFLLSLKMQHFQRRTFYLSIGDICLGIRSQAALLEPYHPPRDRNLRCL